MLSGTILTVAPRQTISQARTVQDRESSVEVVPN